jgi:hypothetical protein
MFVTRFRDIETLIYYNYSSDNGSLPYSLTRVSWKIILLFRRNLHSIRARTEPLQKGINKLKNTISLSRVALTYILRDACSYFAYKSFCHLYVI